jgi:hypothetical protein
MVSFSPYPFAIFRSPILLEIFQLSVAYSAIPNPQQGQSRIHHQPCPPTSRQAKAISGAGLAHEAETRNHHEPCHHPTIPTPHHHHVMYPLPIASVAERAQNFPRRVNKSSWRLLFLSTLTEP